MPLRPSDLADATLAAVSTISDLVLATLAPVSAISEAAEAAVANFINLKLLTISKIVPPMPAIVDPMAKAELIALPIASSNIPI